MLVKLYTSRVLLNVLGIDDYGVWSAVAAFVIAFSFISNPLVTATQRFLNYDMARGSRNLPAIFMTSVEMFIIIAIIVFIGLETLGKWFLDNMMNFHTRNHSIINSLFQFTIGILLINLLRMPFESVIIAEERMSFYAWISVVESLMLLAIAFLIKIDFGIDRLLLYGLLNLLLAGIVMLCYVLFCNRHYSYTIVKRFTFHRNKMKEIAAFSGWNLLGAGATMSATQGITTLINVFFGVVVNAAYGIAVQVQGAVSNIIFNLQKAANPQIVKSFSSGDLAQTRFLVMNVCKFSFLLTLLFGLPIIFNIDYILTLWLGKNVPPLAPQFSSLTLVLLMLVSLSGPMDTAILATGTIKGYQIAYSAVIFSNIVFVYIFFKIGFASYWALIIKCCVELLMIVMRLIFLKKYLKLKIQEITFVTFIPCLVITILGIGVFLGLKYLLVQESQLLRLLNSSIIYILCFFFFSFFIAFSHEQRIKIISTTKQHLSKIYQKK